MSARLLRIAKRPKIAFVAALIAFVFGLPTLFAREYLDDRLHTLVLEKGTFPGGPRGIWDLYHFADGAEGTRGAIAQGMFPWWASPHLKLAFFRPLASLWIAADHAAWSAHPWVPHLESCFLYAALTYVVARLYGRLIGGVAAGLAALLFAVDGAHALPLVWSANRYAMLSALLSFGALLAHVRARETEKWSLGAVVLFTASLFAGEASIGTVGYFLSYAVFADPKGRRAGLLALWPYAIAFLTWAIPYHWLGYGAGGSGAYIDPATSPGPFAIAVVRRTPWLVLGQLFGPPPEVLGLMNAEYHTTFSIVAAVIVTLFLALMLRRARGHRMTAMLLAGALLSAVPTCATLPHARLLLVPGVGLLGVLAIGFARVWESAPSSKAERGFFGLMTVVHFWIAPIMLVIAGIGFVAPLAHVVNKGAASFPSDPGIEGKTLVLLDAPDALTTNYMFVERALSTAPKPKSAFFLTVQTAGSGTVERTGEDTVEVSNPLGQNGGPFTPIYRAEPFVVGETVETSAFRVEVVSLAPDGHPSRLRFVFHESIDAARWSIWKGDHFEEVPVPLMGTPLSLPSYNPLYALN